MKTYRMETKESGEVSESDCDSRSNSSSKPVLYETTNISLDMAQPGYSPRLNPVSLPLLSKGRKPSKSSSSTPGAEKEKMYITKSVSSEMECNSDHAWSDAEEGDIVFGAESSSFDVGHEETLMLAWVKGQKEVVVLIVLTMDLDTNEITSSSLVLIDMLQELKSRLSKQAEHELRFCQLVQNLICTSSEDVNELPAILRLHEENAAKKEAKSLALHGQYEHERVPLERKILKDLKVMDDQEIDEASSDINPNRSSLKDTRPTDAIVLYIDTEEHELGDLGEPANYKAALLDPESKKWLDAKNKDEMWEMQSKKDNRIPRPMTMRYGEMDVKTPSFNTSFPKKSIWSNLRMYKSYLGRSFAMKDLGDAAYILRIKIYRDRSKRLIEEGDIVFGAESSSFDVGHEETPQERGNEGPIGRYVDMGRGHMSQPSKHIHGSQNGSYDRDSLPSGWLTCPPYGMRQLGLVIDLTNTKRYCWEADWTKEGIEYVKIRCAGKDSVPDSKSVDKFIQAVTRFSSQHAHSNKYVLVHCTHGHNRTGYMIVQFLIRSESISVSEAINRFSEARPPGIYKQDYLDDLCNFFGEQLPRTFVCPQTPEWKRSPDRDDDVAFGLQDNDFQASQMTNVVGKCDTMNVVGAGEMANAVGEEEMENVKRPGVPPFPGSHPVSLSRDNLKRLREQYYYSTWKSDGTRYMMLITWDGCYLIDRKFNFRSVDLRFPLGYANGGASRNTHNYTLLDGEMQAFSTRWKIIKDEVINPRNMERDSNPYYNYDLELFRKPFSTRWKIIEDEVINPRNTERHTLSKSGNPYYRYDLELFRVRRKDFHPLSAVRKLLKELIPRLSHASDGLIFQGWDDRYVSLTHKRLLKWKYPEMNSVDFLLELGNHNRPMLYLNEHGRRKLIDGSHGAFRDPSPLVDIFSLSGKIIECSWDSKENVWVFMRMRPDKSAPNEFSSYKKVMRSINDNITEEDVINEIRDIIRLPMYAARIRADCKTFEKNGTFIAANKGCGSGRARRILPGTPNGAAKPTP
ncbi:mRNA-capping enzyme-like protein isoform X2 [Tanacetum coccineum]